MPRALFLGGTGLIGRAAGWTVAAPGHEADREDPRAMAVYVDADGRHVNSSYGANKVAFGIQDILGSPLTGTAEWFRRPGGGNHSPTGNTDCTHGCPQGR